MSGILQSGNITPGHLAAWVTNGVVGDGGAAPAAQRVLTRLSSASFADTGDQPLGLPATMTAFMLTGIIVTNAGAPLGIAQGGFYPQAAKAGTPLVASSQVYSSLNAVTKLLSCTLAAAVPTTRYSRTNLPDWGIYLSLTTGSVDTVATADVYIIGIDLS